MHDPEDQHHTWRPWRRPEEQDVETPRFQEVLLEALMETYRRDGWITYPIWQYGFL